MTRRLSSAPTCNRRSRVISACMQPAPLNVDCAPRRAASEATGRCRSAPEARGFAPVCNRRRGTPSLRCARARHDTSLVIARCSSSHVECHRASLGIARRVSSAPACNRRRRRSTPLRDEPRAKRPADVDRRRKHEASRRCALGAGGLRPFAALGLVMTRRSSSRVARHRTSSVIARRSASRVACHHCVHATGAAECRLRSETSRERSDRQM